MRRIVFFVGPLLSLCLSQSTIGENPNNSPAYHFRSSNDLVKKAIHTSNLPTPEIFDSLRLLLPCKGVPVPTRASRLPNAPRDYRSGVHRGIDFFANWGTSIWVPSNGIVIRADHHYKEIPAQFRVDLLNKSEKVGQTPSDIFHHILLGKAIFLDHGFDLIPGYRVITIYAHMSSIDAKIIPGAIVQRGQFLGRTGNTGTKDSTLGTRKGAHLHWELILQDANDEYYMGQDFAYEDLYRILNNAFVIK